MDKSLVLFGAGAVANAFWEHDRELAAKTKMIVDNDPAKWGKSFKDSGIEIQSPEILRGLAAGQWAVGVAVADFCTVERQVRGLNEKLEILFLRKRLRILRRERIREMAEKEEYGYPQPLISQWTDSLLSKEIGFWEKALKDRGGDYEEKPFSYSLDPSISVEEGSVVLDVGSGPLPIFGNLTFSGRRFRYEPSDPLAYQYKMLLDRYHIRVPVEPRFAIMEMLSKFYPADCADIVIIHNALDHSFDVIRCILEALRVLKPQGRLLMLHFECEGAANNYTGLHQWDITLEEDGGLVVADRHHQKWRISSLIGRFAREKSRRIEREEPCIFTEIVKTAELPYDIIKDAEDHSGWIADLIGDLLRWCVEQG